ncbi:UvrD-helicase domain-containing protein [Amycolatopsis sp. QT-25]|uniref:UvrD-helicase domain-containing protein n=1 Tax=Amycolatopsis sp. QT-25 TaxID=3034022 RepID=UPI0023EDA51C|nr:UvrD-helicase domain-containing protein [Amycolatopsis sp. QT-25]WET77187.1 UvrD-helicase domain-containing protein [Amycolatopsis sp. QT-25]
MIKGRGITTLGDYVAVPRRGRVLRLDASRKAQVWARYEHYQRRLAERDVHDYNDLIELGRAELGARPLETPYAGVVVDEVQDIPLCGLRLLRDLAGDGPNRLLLVGDGQQQVYPGGCPTPVSERPFPRLPDLRRKRVPQRSGLHLAAEGPGTRTSAEDERPRRHPARLGFRGAG